MTTQLAMFGAPAITIDPAAGPAPWESDRHQRRLAVLAQLVEQVEPELLGEREPLLVVAVIRPGVATLVARQAGGPTGIEVCHRDAAAGRLRHLIERAFGRGEELPEWLE